MELHHDTANIDEDVRSLLNAALRFKEQDPFCDRPRYYQLCRLSINGPIDNDIYDPNEPTRKETSGTRTQYFCKIRNYEAALELARHAVIYDKESQADHPAAQGWGMNLINAIFTEPKYKHLSPYLCIMMRAPEAKSNCSAEKWLVLYYEASSVGSSVGSNASGATIK